MKIDCVGHSCDLGRRLVAGDGCQPIDSAGALRVVAGVVVHEGRVLAARRAHGALAGQWEFPGGKVEAGETDAVALVRELQEELGLTVQVLGFVGASRTPRLGTSDVCLLAYAAVLEAGCDPASLVLTDHDAVCWMAPAALQSLQWAPADVPLWRRVQERAVLEL